MLIKQIAPPAIKLTVMFIENGVVVECGDVTRHFADEASAIDWAMGYAGKCTADAVRLLMEYADERVTALAWLGMFDHDKEEENVPNEYLRH